MKPQELKTFSILNMMAFIGVLIVNTLANSMPINGLNTGEVSAIYPNLFVPAGFTFSIWLVIYLLLLGFTIYSLVTAFTRYSPEKPYAALVKIQPLFFITCILNMSWIFLWHHLQIEWSVLIMVIFLVTLLIIFLRLWPFRHSLSATQEWLIRLPFTVYVAWISVATIANITALLVAYKWDGAGISEAVWSCIMIAVASMAAIFFLLKYKEAPYGWVIAWALYGIYYNQLSSGNVVANMALVCLTVISVLAFFSLPFIRNRVVNRR